MYDVYAYIETDNNKNGNKIKSESVVISLWLEQKHRILTILQINLHGLPKIIKQNNDNLTSFSDKNRKNLATKKTFAWIQKDGKD